MIIKIVHKFSKNSKLSIFILINWTKFPFFASIFYSEHYCLNPVFELFFPENVILKFILRLYDCEIGTLNQANKHLLNTSYEIPPPSPPVAPTLPMYKYQELIIRNLSKSNQKTIGPKESIYCSLLFVQQLSAHANFCF